ncbi:MAG: ATP-binding protein, partial [Sphingomonadales bacterium]
GVAHDFNNLLAVILGNVEMATESLDPDHEIRPMLDLVLRAANRGAGLTQHLLAFSRQQILAPKAINLNDVLGEMTGLLSRTLGEQIEISTAQGDELWNCLADRAQTESALLNFALNARDAMPEGGKLTIETTNVCLDDVYAAAQADVEPGNYVMLAVSDSGTGIPPDILEHIFEPFFTTKKVGAGSGLGLSMIYGFAKQSGGHLTVYSEVGEGTTFKLYLPRSKRPVTKEVIETPSLKKRHSGELTVFVVEDDPDVRTLAVALLSDLGYQVMEAGSGPSALEAIKLGGDFDLLFTDVVLPGGMNGPQLAEKVRELRPGTPVLFMSGYTEQAMGDAGRLEEGEDFLQKPFRKKDLERKVRDILGSESG